ncbi:GNAT family N-acetyltransferase [Cryptosporangium phraense]|uniref:GNAT family N-acetyltransferase n=1 Tax=Cryptosporangium phraense TaxID=2593070 RepID=UPI0014782541|nr:GNAT family N-acetyltransferase [Cryptosporangium phraense]
MEPTIVLGGAELIDDVEELWKALHRHHQLGLPGFAYHPDEVSWAVRSDEYRRWLARPGSFVLVAYAGAAPVGYALVEVLDGPEDTWVTGDRIAMLQSLSIAPLWRGRGLGTVLADRVDAELDARGIHDLMLDVVEGNTGAERFYERRGLRRVMSIYARFSG